MTQIKSELLGGEIIIIAASEHERRREVESNPGVAVYTASGLDKLKGLDPDEIKIINEGVKLFPGRLTLPGDKKETGAMSMAEMRKARG